MEDPKQQLVTRLKESANVLVTVSSNPSVDQLSAAIGLTLVLNKMGKHATAVFSGAVPSTIEFLQPEKTLEKNTDSLRDFIIALDKSKADKLRYKVEDKLVKIFITPYRTSIDQNDLVFSQGDFNVDVVIALGVSEQKDLDQAITSHGRILHDATVASVNNHATGKLGAINWVDNASSSLCEMIVSITDNLKADAIDSQIATAFLTGIVAETNRFSNEKTSSSTMSASAKLMAAGANQQLVATKLQEKPSEPPAQLESSQPPSADAEKAESSVASTEKADGALDIQHDLTEEEPDSGIDKIHIDEVGNLRSAEDASKHKMIQPLPDQQGPSSMNGQSSATDEGSRFVFDPPSLGGQLTANADPEGLDPAIDPLSASTTQQPLLSHDSGPASDDTANPSPPVSTNEPSQILPAVDPTQMFDEPVTTEQSVEDSQTLTDIEKAVESPHQEGDSADSPNPNVSAARDAVMDAVNSDTQAEPVLPPIEALNANPTGLELHTEGQDEQTTTNQPSQADLAVPSDPGLPPGLFNEDKPTTDPTAGDSNSPSPPPPVPPPMLPPLPGSSTDQNGPTLPPVQY